MPDHTPNIVANHETVSLAEWQENVAYNISQIAANVDHLQRGVDVITEMLQQHQDTMDNIRRQYSEIIGQNNSTQAMLNAINIPEAKGLNEDAN